jgi:hypothetical protein
MAAKKLAGYLLYVAGCMHHPALALGLWPARKFCCHIETLVHGHRLG